jgi:hypothetical protein
VIIKADMCEPSRVLPAAREVLDFGRSVGLLMVAEFHFVADDRNPRA